MSHDALPSFDLDERRAPARRSHAATVAPPLPAPRKLESPRKLETWASLPARSVGRPSRACRVLNLWVAAFGLLLSAPLILLIAAAIKLTSPGPVFFTQVRIGLDRRRGGPLSGNHRRHFDLGGRPFRIYKFRTMVEQAEKERAVWADLNDPRVTPIGRLLRASRLDELPQLLNVLKGEMSVVGPRPEQPEIFVRLRADIPGYAARQRVLPGITGRAQTRHHYDRCLDDVRKKIRFDLEYIQRQSVLEDLRIMIRTLPVMLLRRGGW